MARIADGLRVLELGSGISGALAGMILADNGAEVIKVEPPDGDANREHPAFRMWSRGKESLVADLGRRRARNRVRELAAEADVWLTSWRPGTSERFGLDADSLAARNPRLVTCAITGFGASGPYAHYPGWEGVVAARAGRMLEFACVAGGERPAYAAVPVASYCASQLALHGIFAALYERERSGRGQHVETSLVQALTVYDLVNWLPGFPTTLRLEDVPFLPYLPACTADGVWLQFAQLSPVQFRAFIRDLGLEALYEEPRFRHAPHLMRVEDLHTLRDTLLARVREKTYAEWMEIFDRDRHIAVERLRTVREAMEHPQIVHDGGVIELDDPEVGSTRQLGPLVRFDATPSQPGAAAPALGSKRDAGWADATGDGREPHRALSLADTKERRVLSGVVVLELATWVATPFAATLLAELGARVIKVEPLGGEPFRQIAHGVPWLKTMQGKESLAADLKRPEGRELIRKLAARADILVHNYRPGVPERLGIDAATLRAINPKLIHLYGASYGSTGPCAAKPAYHPTAGAVCGQAMAQVGAGALPAPDAVLSTEELRRLSRRLELANETNPDPSAAVASATALLMALYHRARTGEAQALETSMLASNAYALSADYVDYEGRPERERADAELLGLGALYRLYSTREGWVFLASPTQRQFERFCKAAGRRRWLRDSRFADAEARRHNDGELAKLLTELFARRSADEWEAELAKRGVGCVRADRGPFARFAFGESWMREAGMVTDVEDSQLGRYTRFGPAVNLSRDNGEVRGPCRAGEQTRAILAELGYREHQIEELGRRGVVGWPDTDAGA